MKTPVKKKKRVSRARFVSFFGRVSVSFSIFDLSLRILKADLFYLI